MSMIELFVKERGRWNDKLATLGVECAEDAVKAQRGRSGNEDIPYHIAKPEENPKFLSALYVRDALDETIKELVNEELVG